MNIEARGVYKITHRASGKGYVGKATNFRFRWFSHKHDVKVGSSLPIHNALRKHGWEAFDFDVIEYCDSDTDALTAEKYWIEWYDTISPKGYNLTTGGEGATPTAEVREKIRQSKLGKKRGPQTPEWREAIGASQRGKRMSPGSCAQISQSIREHWNKRRAAKAATAKAVGQCELDL